MQRTITMKRTESRRADRDAMNTERLVVLVAGLCTHGSLVLQDVDEGLATGRDPTHPQDNLTEPTTVMQR